MHNVVRDALKEHQPHPPVTTATPLPPIRTELTHLRQEATIPYILDIDRELVYSTEFMRYKSLFFEGKTDPLTVED